MLYSMTGFGRAEKTTPSQRIVVEIKSINSKSFDLRTRISSQYQSKEIELRKLINSNLIRGKVDLTLTVENTLENDHAINKQAFDNYYEDLMKIANKHNISNGDLLYTVTRLPGVIVQNNDAVDENAWEVILEVIEEALAALNHYRADEGSATFDDILSHIRQIETLLTKVDPAEEERIEKIKTRLLSSLEQLQVKGRVDENRLEQEMIYYLDKFDLNEEKVRLQQHCSYFVDELEKKTPSKGKKLNFILQEIGREINTLGSKANSAVIQRLVIQMKNEADKIKEQLSNIL
ncbi:YicC/YloC family endoribonuclease [Aureispira anguillae]|uniref:YicC family protein n=1 Tax=Aureispira anguillae TaxID=2864201 RepID=A0A916DTS9_9BACT|nr:YicC/YloC family endoribonuclease [Aureispira anguillae]BDS13524.1 YicC family protein [Aureispira anguillae]